MDSNESESLRGLSLDDLRRNFTTRSPPAQVAQENHSPAYFRSPNSKVSSFSSSPVTGVVTTSPVTYLGQAPIQKFSFDFTVTMAGEQDSKRIPLLPSHGNNQAITANPEKLSISKVPSSPRITDLPQVTSPQPQFGKPTALGAASPVVRQTSQQDVPGGVARRNVVKGSDSFDHLFSKSRPKAPEFYKPSSTSNPLQQLGKLGTTQQPTQIRSSNPTSQSSSISQSNSRQNDDVFVIPKPGNFSTQSHRPPVPPTFSSNINSNPYFQVSNNFVDLTKPMEFRSTNDDAFDDRQVFGNDRFGLNDPYMYLDSDKANENIKALLEGAMDEDDDKPRTRRKQKEKLESQIENVTNKLQSIDVSSEDGKKGKQPNEDEEEEDDDGTREGLKVKLLPHQIEGVDWMRNKELGTKKVKGILPKGGILADDMGLGKTIQSIALMLANPKSKTEELQSSKRTLDPKTDKATLIVAPLALLKQWEGEIRDRIDLDHALQVRVHHGPQRTKSYKDLRKYDVVITTYQTLSSEHAEGGESLKSALFGVNWFRVILDEAHSVKNRNAKSTKAACALNAEYRWCLTGTPMQNNLDELQSLIHFLRIKPYDNLEVWREQITKPMNNGRGGLAIRRLRAFLSAFMKRRTKDVLKESTYKDSVTGQEKKSTTGFQIVQRTVEKVEAEFSEQEQVFYHGLEARTDRSLERMMAGNQLSYANALVLLMRLRQACNHPKLLKVDLATEQDPITQTPSRKTSKTTDVDEIANMLGGLSVETKRCDVCQIELDEAAVKAGLLRCDECETELKAQESSSQDRTRKHKLRNQHVKKERSVNRRVILDSDDETEIETKSSAKASTSYSSSIEEVEDDSDSGSDFDSATEARPDLVSSTKIRHLIKILQKDSHTHKYIVFSFFTSMLNLIEPFMHHHHIKFVRYDGAMRNDMREASLESLRNDPTVRVLLCSLRAGSLGLNLTAASRVVILEPFWNPFVEEQAIDRVHRLNQTQDVVVHKLTIKNTVEARILELQERKRELANATIEGQKDAGAAKLSLQEMLKLFRHNNERDDKLDLLAASDRGGLLDGGESTAQNVRVKKTPRKEDPIYGRRW